MKNRFLILILGVALGAGATWFSLHRPAEQPEKKESTPAAPPEAKDERPGVTLSAAQQTQAGLQLARPRAAKLFDEQTGYARAVDASALLSAFADLELAEATASSSEKEYARLKGLHENGENASGQAVDAAALAARRDRIQVSTTLVKARATWGPLIADPSLRQRLATELVGSATLLRVEFNRDEPMDLAGKKVSLGRPDQTNSSTLQAEVLAPATTVDTQFQGQSVWALLPGKTLPVGLAMDASVQLEATAKPALLVPTTALLRNDGKINVYIKAGPEKFIRRRVEILQTTGDAVAVSGVGPDDEVVSVGAQQLLSTELGGEAQGD